MGSRLQKRSSATPALTTESSLHPCWNTADHEEDGVRRSRDALVQQPGPITEAARQWIFWNDRRANFVGDRTNSTGRGLKSRTQLLDLPFYLRLITQKPVG